MGPTVFRTPSTPRAAALALRSGISYFELDEAPTRAVYVVDGSADASGQAGYGYRTNSGVLQLAASYGVTDDLEATLDVPLSLVDFDGTVSIGNAGEQLTRTESSTGFGLGQVSIGAKYGLSLNQATRVAASLDLLLPSPSEAEFAGADSFGVTPRLLGSAQLARSAIAYADIGYTYQTEFEELSGLQWVTGLSAFTPAGIQIDLGFGGTLYQKGVKTTLDPVTLDGGLVITPAAGAERLGRNYVNFLLGLKYGLSDSFVLTGSFVIPVNDEGVRPAAAGSFGLEYYL